MTPQEKINRIKQLQNEIKQLETICPFEVIKAGTVYQVMHLGQTFAATPSYDEDIIVSEMDEGDEIIMNIFKDEWEEVYITPGMIIKEICDFRGDLIKNEEPDASEECPHRRTTDYEVGSGEPIICLDCDKVIG